MTDHNNEDSSDSEIEDPILDTKWLEEFDLIDKDYAQYYKEDVNNISMQYIYVNKKDEIEEIKKDVIALKSPNYISREELVGILKRRSYNTNKRYTVLSILKYNIDIEPEDISHFLVQSSIDNNSFNIFLNKVHNIDAIPLNKTISIFRDLNDIIIIFYEKSNQLNQTKKIYIKPTTSSLLSSKSKRHKKTARLHYASIL
jgi:hypothetical protein